MEGLLEPRPLVVHDEIAGGEVIVETPPAESESNNVVSDTASENSGVSWSGSNKLLKLE